MIQMPHEFFFDECIKLGVHLPSFGKYGVGMILFPKEIRLREECRDIFNRSAEKLGLEILAYTLIPHAGQYFELLRITDPHCLQ